MKYNNFPHQIQEVKPMKNHLRGKLRMCERCSKMFRDEFEPDKKTIDGQLVTSEYIPLCPLCFKKALHSEKRRQLILGAIGDKIITKEEYDQWKKRDKKKQRLISSKTFFDKINAGIRKVKKENLLAEVLVNNENYMHTKHYKRTLKKSGVSEKNVISLANKKMRDIMENENEEFLEND